MKAIIDDFTTDIYLSEAEVREYCKPGQDTDTCIWLLVGAEGFECCYYHKPTTLLTRWETGLTVAKRDVCAKVEHFDPGNQDSDVVEF